MIYFGEHKYTNYGRKRVVTRTCEMESRAYSNQLNFLLFSSTFLSLCSNFLTNILHIKILLFSFHLKIIRLESQKLTNFNRNSVQDSNHKQKSVYKDSIIDCV